MSVEFNEESQRMFLSDVWSLKATKVLECWKVGPFWPTEKANKYRAIDKNSEKSPHLRTELTTDFPKIQNMPYLSYFHTKIPQLRTDICLSWLN